MNQEPLPIQSENKVMKVCEYCHSDYFVESRLKNVERKFCSRSCSSASKNTLTKTKDFEIYKNKLPVYLEADWTQYKNTRSKITFYDKEYDEYFTTNIFNVLNNGMKGKKRNAANLRSKTINDLQNKLPSNIILIEKTYSSFKTKCSFKNTDTGEVFDCPPQRVLNKLKGALCLKRKENKVRDLLKYKQTLPIFLILHEETYTAQNKKAKFTDTEYNVTYWGRARVPNQYGVAICKERKTKEFRDRSCLTEEELKKRLFDVYGDEIQLNWLSYKSFSDVAEFKMKDGKIVKYNMSDALAGYLKGDRGKLIAWTQAVKERDKVCLITGAKERLCAHHILSKRSYPEYQFEVNNGAVLCEDLHIEFHSRYGKKNNNKFQLLEFSKTKGVDLSERLKDCPVILK